MCVVALCVVPVHLLLRLCAPMTAAPAVRCPLTLTLSLSLCLPLSPRVTGFVVSLSLPVSLRRSSPSDQSLGKDFGGCNIQQVDKKKNDYVLHTDYVCVSLRCFAAVWVMYSFVCVCV